MNRATFALLAVGCLVLAGCSSASPDDKPAATITVTKTPALTAAQKHQACVDAWTTTIKARPTDFDPDTDHEDIPSACDGLPEQLKMYWEASSAIAQANRDSIDACIDSPTCTSWPLPTP